MAQYFQQLENELIKIKAYAPPDDRRAFFIQEVLRFHSIAGTIEQSFKNIASSTDERIITHILVRSLIENFFRILYIFDDSTLSKARFDECVNGFKIQYAKLYNDQALPNKNQIEPADTSWPSLKAPMDLNSMLAALMNAHGNRISYIYFVYRISSFDTHGNSLEALFNASFNKKPCNFPVLKIEQVTELIANQYLVTWNNGNIA
ncbi:MAG: hypothetical protein ACREA4_12410 [Nitrososphaera sp.]